jgi:hypothetical protein
VTTASTTAASTTSTIGTSVLPVVAPPKSPDELATHLVSVAPAGFTLQPDDVGDTGPSDLAKAVRDDGSPGVEQTLRKEGFVRGYQRLWVGPGEAEIIVFVYQFETAAGAEANFQRAKPGLLTDAPPGAKPVDESGLPVGHTASIAGSTADLSAATVIFATGIFNVQIVTNGPVLADVQTRAAATAKDQFSRL